MKVYSANRDMNGGKEAWVYSATPLNVNIIKIKLQTITFDDILHAVFAVYPSCVSVTMADSAIKQRDNIECEYTEWLNIANIT